MNGAFAKRCSERASYENPKCLDHLQFGAAIIGDLPMTGRRAPLKSSDRAARRCTRRADVDLRALSLDNAVFKNSDISKGVQFASASLI